MALPAYRGNAGGGGDRRSDYFALAVSCAALVSTHAFALLLYIICSLYHLLFVAKDRRWLLSAVAAVAGLLLAAPLISVLYTTGVDFALDVHNKRAVGIGEILPTWLHVTSNGSPFLLALAAVGAGLGWRRQYPALRTCSLLFGLLILGIALVTEVTRTLDVGLMRHLLSGLPIAVLFQAAGLYALYRERKWLGALLCLWVLAGIVFMNSADWYDYIQNRIRSYVLPPWHLVSRLARESGDQARVIGYMLPDKMLAPSTHNPDSLTDYWFTRRDIEFRLVGSARWLEEYLHHYRGERHSPWLAYQTTLSDAADVAAMQATMDALGYRVCRRESLPVATEMVQYSWISLGCQPARVALDAQSDALRYEFYGAELAPSGSWLMFAHRLTLDDTGTQANLYISHQLIAESGQKLAQIDQPLSAEQHIRQWGMDVREVPPGRYTLIAIVYNYETGQRHIWRDNATADPGMLSLGEIIIPVQ